MSHKLRTLVCTIFIGKSNLVLKNFIEVATLADFGVVSVLSLALYIYSKILDATVRSRPCFYCINYYYQNSSFMFIVKTNNKSQQNYAICIPRSDINLKAIINEDCWAVVSCYTSPNVGLLVWCLQYLYKIPAYGRHSISQRERIIATIQ